MQGCSVSQLQGKFLQIPYDVRREIFTHLVPRTVHVHTERGQMRFADCVPTPTPHATSPGLERTEGLPLTAATERKAEHISIWTSRLLSSWGPHWKCEENVYGADHDMRKLTHSAVEILLRVCTTMYVRPSPFDETS
jgi:hypothetical protein